ncbi:PorH family porin [Corynebacterium argentoratense]|nr:PorH family porin [Corynebacterium argentoratense]
MDLSVIKEQLGDFATFVKGERSTPLREGRKLSA